VANESFDKIIHIYSKIKPEIISRLREFREIWEKGTDEDIFKELVFCLLTPQSNARLCWEAVKNLAGLLLKGSEKNIAQKLVGVRFNNNKARYIIEARRLFTKDGKIQMKTIISEFSSNTEAREWLRQNVKGMGYKEASHFLRNIGFGKNLAILDRHILKNLRLSEIIEKIPASLGKKIYLEIETKMQKFAEEIDIPMEHLDFVLWYKETGVIFK